MDMNSDFRRQNNSFNIQDNLSYFMQTPPVSWAIIRGSRDYPQINGTVWFYQLSKGTLVIAEINGLPKNNSPCNNPIFAFHIHEGNSCAPQQPPQRPIPQPQPPQRPMPQPQPPQRPTPQPQPPQRPMPQPQPPQRPMPQPQPPQRPTPQPQPPQRPTPQPQPPQRPTPQIPPIQIIPIIPPFTNRSSRNSGQNTESFPNSGTHYNPHRCQHPYHAGDMPPLFSADGYAFLSFVTNRFTAKEIRGRTIILHSQTDDFTTQPSGNSGTKIACGVIEPS